MPITAAALNTTQSYVTLVNKITTRWGKETVCNIAK